MYRMKTTLVLAALFTATISQAQPNRVTTVSGWAKPNIMYPVRVIVNNRATFDVEGDGSGDIDCYLYEGDMHGGHARFVARDDGPRDGCHLEATPTAPNTFTLLMQNPGLPTGKTEHYTVTIRQ